MDGDIIQENLLLREQVDLLNTIIKDLRQEKTALQQKLAEALYRIYVGRRSEKIHPKQLHLFLQELVAEAEKENAALDEDAAPTTKRRSRRNGRKPLPEALKRERTVVDLADEEKVCPCCEQALTPIGEDVTEVLEYVPASFVVKEIVRPKYACKSSDCRGTVKSASLPPMPIEKGRPGPGLLAHVITSKYVDHQPLYRQSAIFARDGVDLHRSTLCEWTDAAGGLLRPVAMAMWHRIKAGGYLQADETPIKVLQVKPGTAHRAYLWGYGVPRGEVMFDFSLSRSKENPERMLEGFRGLLQVDAYGGYNGVVDGPDVTRIGCFAHVRRRFLDARDEYPEEATFVLAAIQLLYRIERAIRDASPEKRVEVRQDKADAILDVLKARLEEFQGKVLPKSTFGEALKHALTHWEELTGYLENGQAEIDNNWIENAMRPVALGRKNFLFAGSPNGGQKAAVLYSLATSCRRIGIEPREYLRDVIDRVSTHPMAQIDELTPLGWKQARAATQP